MRSGYRAPVTRPSFVISVACSQLLSRRPGKIVFARWLPPVGAEHELAVHAMLVAGNGVSRTRKTAVARERKRYPSKSPSKSCRPMARSDLSVWHNTKTIKNSIGCILGSQHNTLAAGRFSSVVENCCGDSGLLPITGRLGNYSMRFRRFVTGLVELATAFAGLQGVLPVICHAAGVKGSELAWGAGTDTDFSLIDAREGPPILMGWKINSDFAPR